MDSEKGKKVEAAGVDATPAPAKGKSRAKKDRLAKAAKPVKEPRAKREPVENPVVFAFRLSEADRTRIHEAAGGGKASQFVLAAALAAAEGNVEAFKQVVASRATQ